MSRSITILQTPDRDVADIRLGAFRRRFKTTEPVERLLVELAFGLRDGMAPTIRTTPISMEVHTHG